MFLPAAQCPPLSDTTTSLADTELPPVSTQARPHNESSELYGQQQLCSKVQNPTHLDRKGVQWRDDSFYYIFHVPELPLPSLCLLALPSYCLGGIARVLGGLQDESAVWLC